MSNNYLKESKFNSNQRFKVWLNQSKYDLDAANSSFKAQHYEWTCYQTIQSVEKALKSVIVHAGYRPPKIHKLGILIGMSNSANDLFKNVKFKFRKIEAYTFISRYPFVIPGENITPHELVTKKDASTCLSIARDIYDKVENFVLNQKDKENKDLVTSDYYFSGIEIENRINDIKEKILNCEKLEVEKIILFGSFAREKTRPKTSTMDILIIAKTDLEFIERMHYVRDITKGAEPIIEPLVYTPDEYLAMREEEGEGFLESAIEEGKVIWEKR